MLNTKYFIATKQAEGVIQNPAALGNAWFVNNIIEVKNADEEILKTSTTNTANIAIYDARYSDYFSDFEINDSAKGNIELTEYTPDRLVYKSTSDGDRFAVFSEVFYEGGWQAYLDGEKVDHVRVNYVLRGMKIPEGEHEIVFEFTPEHWQTAWIVSGASTALIALFVLYSLFLEWKRMKND